MTLLMVIFIYYGNSHFDQLLVLLLFYCNNYTIYLFNDSWKNYELWIDYCDFYLFTILHILVLLIYYILLFTNNILYN